MKGYLPYKELGEEERNKSVEHDLDSKERTKQAFDRKAKVREFNIGDTVLVKCPQNNKFAIKGQTAVVIKQIDSHSVLLRDTSSTEKYTDLAHEMK